MLDQEFKLKPSKIFLTALFAVLAISIVIIFYLPFTLLIKSFVLLPVLIYLGYIVWRDGLLRSKHSIISIRRHADGNWLLQSNSKMDTAILRGDSTITAAVSVLRFRLQQNFWPASCVIFFDSLSRERYRELVVILRTY